MVQKKSLILGLLLMTLVINACSTARNSTETLEENNIQVETPTPTPEPENELEDSSTESDDGQDLADTDDLDLWLLTATYHWENGRTKTDILYTYQTLLELTEKVVEHHSTGFAEGMGGMNINGECIEAQPVTIEWDYQFSAEIVHWDAEMVNQTFGEEAAQNASAGKARMLEVSFSQPEVTLFEMEPFACAPDMDPEFIQSLATFWTTVIPELPPEDTTIPAEEGIYCLLPLDFSDEDLGILSPCYKLERYSE